MTSAAAQKALDMYVQKHAGRFRRSMHTSREINDMLELSKKALSVRATRFPDDPGGEYKELYDACVVAANALVDAYGYATSGDGGHEAALHAAEGVMRTLGDESAATGLRSVREIMRPLRHAATYEAIEAVSTEDVEFAREMAGELCPLLWASTHERLKG